MVHEDVYRAGTPFIYVLMQELSRQHPNEVQCGYGRNEFWSDSIFDYDILTFHFPQAFMNGDKHSLKDLADHIDRLKKRHVKITAFCHDLKPHYYKSGGALNAMDIVYEKCDMIFHMGEYSLNLLSKQYPQIKHVILPHPLYNRLYTKVPTREEAIKKLSLKRNKHYILSFGAFRADEERQLVIEMASHFKNQGVEFLAPAFMKVPRERRISFIPNRMELKACHIKHKYHIHFDHGGFAPVDDKTLPYYYAACDFAFVQRKKILNSGNAVMPLLFDKVAVGPDVGNVGPLLKSYGYPTFNPDDTKTAIQAIDEAFKMKDDAGKNHDKAMSIHSTEVVSEKLYEYYLQLLSSKETQKN